MQSNIAAVSEATSNIAIVVKALLFGNDDPMGSILNRIQHLNMKHNLRVLTGSELATVQGNSHNVPTHTDINSNGSPIVYICTMETRLNTNEFHRIDTIRCGVKGVAVEW
jgi:hypothetical protein